MYYQNNWIVHDTVTSQDGYGLSGSCKNCVLTKFVRTASSDGVDLLDNSVLSHFSSININAKALSLTGSNSLALQGFGYGTTGGGYFDSASNANQLAHFKATNIVDNGTASNYATAVTTGLSAASLASAVYNLVTADSVNTSHTGGIQAYNSISDWFNFENPFRLWGKDSLTHGGPCASGDCQIFDFRIRPTDTLLFNRSGDGTNPNDNFIAGSTCPSAVNGNYALSHLGRTFLVHALEIFGDAVGNENGLCESNEACIYSPHYGAYQGMGDYMAAGTCQFSNGSVSNVQMYAYPLN